MGSRSRKRRQSLMAIDPEVGAELDALDGELDAGVERWNNLVPRTSQAIGKGDYGRKNARRIVACLKDKGIYCSQG